MNWLMILMLVIIDLVTAIVAKCLSTATIECLSRGRIEQVSLADGRKLSCTFEAIGGGSHSNQDEHSAPPVEENSLHLMAYMSRGKKQALEISWIQKESHLRLEEVNGYFLIVDQSYYQIKFEISKTKNGMKKNISCIKFVLRNYGTKYQSLRAGDEINVTVFPQPHAHIKNNFNDASTWITMPSKKKMKKNKKKPKVINPQAVFAVPNHQDITTQRIIYVNTEMTSAKKDPILMTALFGSAAACFLAFLLAFGILIMKKTRKMRNRKQTDLKEDLPSRKILMISDNLSGHLMYEVHCLAKFLIGDSRLKVVCNWKCREAIAQNQMSWYEEHMHLADVIILIPSRPFEENTFLRNNRTESQNYSDEFWKAKNCAQRHKWNDQSKEIILLTNQVGHDNQLKKENINYSVYDLKTEYSFDDEFYKHLLGYSKPGKEEWDIEPGRTG